MGDDPDIDLTNPKLGEELLKDAQADLPIKVWQSYFWEHSTEHKPVLAWCVDPDDPDLAPIDPQQAVDQAEPLVADVIKHIMSDSPQEALEAARRAIGILVHGSSLYQRSRGQAATMQHYAVRAWVIQKFNPQRTILWRDLADRLFKKDGKCPRKIRDAMGDIVCGTSKHGSGTGAGKTGSAGLASYVIGSKLTVVLCPNSTVKQWADELTLAFPDCKSVTKVADAKRGVGSFLILNYEKFQSEKSSSLLVRNIVELSPDFIVLDEIHLLKRRDQNRSSIRREELVGMLQQLPKTRVLGMTATPVINELREGVSLLEAVTGKEQDLKTFRSVTNALRLHFALLQHGLRYKPEYQQGLSIKVKPFVENAVLPALRRIAEQGSNDVLAIEQTILPAKLEQVRDWIKPGTLIYLEFVEGMVPVVRRYVESLGLSVKEYTGNRYIRG